MKPAPEVIIVYLPRPLPRYFRVNTPEEKSFERIYAPNDIIGLWIGEETL